MTPRIIPPYSDSKGRRTRSKKALLWLIADSADKDRDNYKSGTSTIEELQGLSGVSEFRGYSIYYFAKEEKDMEVLDRHVLDQNPVFPKQIEE
jgi:hypothetical protein